jgi:hypothetical protein
MRWARVVLFGGAGVVCVCVKRVGRRGGGGGGEGGGAH